MNKHVAGFLTKQPVWESLETGPGLVAPWCAAGSLLLRSSRQSPLPVVTSLSPGGLQTPTVAELQPQPPTTPQPLGFLSEPAESPLSANRLLRSVPKLIPFCHVLPFFPLYPKSTLLSHHSMPPTSFHVLRHLTLQHVLGREDKTKRGSCPLETQ